MGWSVAAEQVVAMPLCATALRDATGGHRYEVALDPEWATVERLRDFVALWVQPALRDEALVEAVVLVTSELLENAVRHGIVARIGFEIMVAADGVRIRVINAYDPESGNQDLLLARLRWLNSIPDAAEAYRVQVGLVGSGAVCGLGLVRMAHVGRCVLGCELDTTSRLVAVEAFIPPPHD